MSLRTRLAAALAAGVLAASLAACSYEYLVQVTNRRDEPVAVEIDQFRGDAPGITPPREFIAALRLRRDRIELGPGATRTVKFSAASGGFWLRWRRVGAAPESSAYKTVDLLSDALVIDVR